MRRKQAQEFPQPRPDSALWAAYERNVTVTATAIDAVRDAQNVPFAIREAAGQLGGQMSVWLRQRADRLDPAGRGLTAEAAEQARVAREAREARRVEAARRQEQMAEHVRAAWPAGRAERVIGSEAWPVLAFKLDQLDAAGQDVQQLLRGVPSFVDKAHTPAAYTFRVLDDADDRAEADGVRADERDQRTIEADWRETRTDPASVAEEHAEDAHGVAEQDADWIADWDASREQRAAQVAAQGYPDTTADAVAGAAAAKASGKRPVKRAAKAARGRPGQQRTPRDPRGR
jgi:hypothetical protein